MIKKNYYKYILGVTLGLIVTHIFWSYFIGSLTSFLYDSSIINVRNYIDDEQISLTQAYLNQKIKSAKNR
ncbi:hypothetical protein EP47_03115 [Legionella norrlandica]|uniref:Uncharacterized protein n=1 Tax=Legionella norrlandica TaxID=1498499 RepID=A0A0A2SS88_9GAMM|nr:hypothetical protein EP47_03115 [Legionella norrlandica]